MDGTTIAAYYRFNTKHPNDKCSAGACGGGYASTKNCSLIEKIYESSFKNYKLLRLMNGLCEYLTDVTRYSFDI